MLSLVVICTNLHLFLKFGMTYLMPLIEAYEEKRGKRFIENEEQIDSIYEYILRKHQGYL